MVRFLEFYEEVFGWCITSEIFRGLIAGILLLGICAVLTFIFIKITLWINKVDKNNFRDTPKSGLSWPYNEIDKQTPKS